MKYILTIVPKGHTFFDVFSGTGIVSYSMLDTFEKIISNDLELYSFILLNALIKCNYSPKLQKIIDDCNKLEGQDGLITQHYSKERLFFTEDNAKKCDHIRTYIEDLFTNKSISQNEYYFLLGTLLVSTDKVANTASIYGAYLKEIKKSALNELVMKPIHQKTNISEFNEVYNKKSEELVKEVEYDVCYLDPPYNHRQYSGNYSFLNYLALYDSEVEIKGMAGLLLDCNKSDFCSKRNVEKVFEELIKDIKCKHIILSYNNEGLLSLEKLKKILLKKGDVTLYKIKYGKFNSHTATETTEKQFVEEYLWHVCPTNNTENLYQEVSLS